MFTLPSGVEIPDEDLPIWNEYNFKCVLCVYQPAVCLHEAPPKSKNFNWREEPWNRWPVCNFHHDKLHQSKLKVQLALLENNRRAYFPKAEENLREWQKLLNQTQSLTPPPAE